MVKYAYSNPRKKMGKYRVKSVVHAVHKSETADGRYHEVSWAADGNLNASWKRGNVKRFRLWADAKKFANKKASQIGTKALID